MFENIIGNEKNKELLKNIIDTNNIAHSYMFVGKESIGKLLFAKEFAKAILCENENIKPCNTCKACMSFETENNPDIIIIDQKEDTIKTEQIKNLVSNVLEKPIQSKKKIYIINNSENMTKEAQNSLLKTLEEPPEYVVIILVTKNDNLLLNTIKSRCIKISFNSLTRLQIKEYFTRIAENINDNMYEVFGGSLENALNLKDKQALYDKINNSFKKIENLNELQILKLKEDLFVEKEDVFFILDYLNTIFHNKAIENVQNSVKYSNCIKIIEETKNRIKSNSNYDMAIDNFLFTIWREFNKNG